MSKFAMAAIDMDGTLLNSNHEITPLTLEILREADAKGCKIVLCTGRIFPAVKPYIEQLGLDGFVIVGNGAQIRKSPGGEIIAEYLLSKDIIVKMARVGNEYGGHPRVYGTDGRVYVESLSGSDLDYSSWTNTEIVPIENFEKNLPTELVKIINVMPDDESSFKVLNKGKELFGEKIYMTRGMMGFVECMNSRATKGLAVEKLADICSIPLEQVIVAGDHYNDLTMYDLPGVFGITCSNAQEVVRERAKRIGKSNDEDGIALLIKELGERAMGNKKSEKFDAGMKKAKEGFEKAKAGMGNVVGKTMNSEVVKKMTMGQKLAVVGVAALLTIIAVGLIGRLMFSPDLSIWGVTEAPSTQLAFKIDGTVSQVLVSAKQVVKKGELIARIDEGVHLTAWEEANGRAMDANLELLRMDERFKPKEIAVAEAKLKAAESAAEVAAASLELAKIYEEEFRSKATEGAISSSHHEESLNVANEAEGNLQSANKALEEAKNNLERIEKGFSEEEIANAKSNLDDLAAKADGAKAALDGASIVAPFDGYVATLKIENGAKAVANEPVCEFVDLSKLSIKSMVEESVARGIKPGSPVYVEFRDFVGEEYRGKIVSVSPAVNSKCEVRVELDSPSDNLLPGMEATVLFADI